MTSERVSRKAVTSALLEAMAYHWISKRMAVHFEVGVEAWGRKRIDMITFDFKAQNLTFCEIKSCAADFDSDKKWKSYLKYCNKFFFVVTEDYWNTAACDRLREAAKSEGAGVFILTKHGYVKSVLRHGPTRDTLPVGFLRSLITKLAWRSGFNRSNTRARKVNIK